METNRFADTKILIAVVSFVLACAAQLSGASDDAVSTRPRSVCRAESPRLPDTVQLADDLRADVHTMLRQSATFRNQCQRIADTRLLYVRVRRNPGLVERSYRAKSVIVRARSGVIVVLVELSSHGSPVEWIAHEFEHVLEQLDGVRLRQLAGRSGVWQSSEGMFETERAILAGRTVVEQMRHQPRIGYKLVE